MDAVTALERLDWKRRVFALYDEIRQSDAPPEAWNTWRSVRDELFRDHPQSPLPLEERGASSALRYFDYDENFRVLALVEPAAPERFEIATSGEQPMKFERFAVARFALMGQEHALDLFWLSAYGGGLFLPFADETNATSTYGAGRYLLDTVKGADLGSTRDRLVLDFNFAYNPSCSYDPRWVCPLAPPGNRMKTEVTAGERL